MQEAASDSKTLAWAAGAFFMAWNSLLTLILGHHMKQLGNIKKDREDHCIPRPECERTHEALNKRLDGLEQEFKNGITGIHQRLDKLLGGKG